MLKLAAPSSLFSYDMAGFQSVLDHFVAEFVKENRGGEFDSLSHSIHWYEARYWQLIHELNEKLEKVLGKFLKDRFHAIHGVPTEEEIFEDTGDTEYLNKLKKDLDYLQGVVADPGIESNPEQEKESYNSLKNHKRKIQKVKEITTESYYDKKIGQDLYDLLDKGHGLFLVYMTLAGEGIGIWDNDVWENVLSKDGVKAFQKIMNKDLSDTYHEIQNCLEFVAIASMQK